MASHYIAIAKASFVASCLRPDPTPVGRDEIGRFHTLLDTAALQCSPSNVQKCKAWLCANVLSSPARTTAFAKYLAALGNSYGKPPVGTSPAAKVNGGTVAAQQKSSTETEKPSPITKRLYLLYVLSDVLHHVRHHNHINTGSHNTPHPDIFTSVLPHLTSLLNTAASCDSTQHRHQHGRLEELLYIWEESKCYGREDIAKLRETVASAAATSANSTSARQSTAASSAAEPVPAASTALPAPTATPAFAVPFVPTAVPSTPASNAPPRAAAVSSLPPANTTTASTTLTEGRTSPPYILPAMHGDAYTPYYDLPAGTLLPHFTPARAQGQPAPINPANVRPLYFQPGPPAPELITAVQDLLKAANDIYGPSGGNRAGGVVIEEATGRIVSGGGARGTEEQEDVDEMGQRLVRDEDGEWVPVEGYYGWSVEFCRRMRAKKRDARGAEEAEMDRGRLSERDGGGRGRPRSYERDDEEEDDWDEGGAVGLGMARNSGMGMGMGMGASVGMGMGMGMGMGTGRGLGFGSNAGPGATNTTDANGWRGYRG